VIQQVFEKYRKLGKTILVIAHRSSTIINSDHIIVLSHGKIAQQGSHKDLIGLEGEYASLINGSPNFKN
jgi:ABC-type transport system involved in Fe-S cluster assembly fused permease/ATPase subunit